MPAAITFSVRDHSGENGRVTLRTVDLTSTNYDAQHGDAPGSAYDDILVALQGMILGTVVQATGRSFDRQPETADPASAFAQRETGIRFQMTGADGRRYSVTVPTPDLAAIATQGTDDVDLSAAPVSAFVAALEANVVDESGGAVTVNSAKIVGRNN